MKEAESSESRIQPPRQSAVFGVAVQSKAQPRRNEKRSRSELTRQSPQSVGGSSRLSRERSRHLASVVSHEGDEALSR